MLEMLVSYLPLAQFALAFVAVPLWKIIMNQKEQLTTLLTIVQNQQETITFVHGIVLESSSPEVITKHLIAQKKRKEATHHER